MTADRLTLSSARGINRTNHEHRYSPCSLPSRWSSTFRACGARSPKAKRWCPRRRARSRSASPTIDAALGGGLACAALHELSATPVHLGAAAGFALALAALSPAKKAKQTLWIATDFGMLEAGALYGPGLDQIGLRYRAAPGRARRAAGRCAVGHGGGAEMPRALGPWWRRCRRAPISPRRGGSRSPRATAARSGCCCATRRCRCAERGAHALAGRRRAERARSNSAGSAAPPSIFRSHATGAARCGQLDTHLGSS